ncbi:PREDICTED: myosin light chain kinase family member 4-like [Papilio polytes]|uniref:myosin light chain kinase family member 4-like n=1 Tax=Papilio polytes TaxID=76194 RepID=UPI0006769E9A|nr:PREDICTED: myosin light chain kinase family member 4-like [Papilio polytes]XP_013147413.1 PREDICTED: myosin light chain kinase family member 4-like [Papilio polytes]
MFPIQRVKTCAKDYRMTKNIGQGSFGSAYKLKNIVTNSKVAGKFIRLSGRNNENRIRKEIAIIASLQHENVIEYVASYSSPRGYIIVTKYYSGKTLYHRRLNENFEEQDVALCVRQICNGINYIHQKNIVHRDIKATNIVLETKHGKHVRIIDFGLSCKLDDENNIIQCGTKTYLAPEVIRSEQITGAVDMWSLGVLTYWLLSLTHPFPACSEQSSLIVGGQYTYNAKSFEGVSVTARNFINSLLVVQTEVRLTASSALQHSWLSLTLNNDPSSTN